MKREVEKISKLYLSLLIKMQVARTFLKVLYNTIGLSKK